MSKWILDATETLCMDYSSTGLTTCCTYLGCELQEDEWGNVGTIFILNYLLDGKKQFAKLCLEALDEVNRSITYKVCDGDILKAYKSFKEHLHFDGKGDNDCTFTWTFEYEKMSENVPDPDSVFEAVQSIIKYAETHIVESAQDISKDLKIPQLQ